MHFLLIRRYRRPRKTDRMYLAGTYRTTIRVRAGLMVTRAAAPPAAMHREEISSSVSSPAMEAIQLVSSSRVWNISEAFLLCRSVSGIRNRCSRDSLRSLYRTALQMSRRTDSFRSRSRAEARQMASRPPVQTRICCLSLCPKPRSIRALVIWGMAMLTRAVRARRRISMIM